MGMSDCVEFLKCFNGQNKFTYGNHNMKFWQMLLYPKNNYVFKLLYCVLKGCIFVLALLGSGQG